MTSVADPRAPGAATRRGTCRIGEDRGDIELRATGPGLEEAMAALASGFGRATVLIDRGAGATAIAVSVAGRDPRELAIAWLVELVGIGDERLAGIARAEVDPIAEPPAGEDGHHGMWRVHGCVWVVRLGFGARPRLTVRSVATNRVRVQRTRSGWRITAPLEH